MKATEGRVGRVFIIRLDNGDKIPGVVERFATENNIKNGFALLIGDVVDGQIVVGPRKSDEMPPEPMLLPVEGAHEIAGVGILSPDEKGKPVLHIHAALGRSRNTMTGCLRPGVLTWLVAEVILYEIIGVSAVRVKDAASGFALLKVDGGDEDGQETYGNISLPGLQECAGP